MERISQVKFIQMPVRIEYPKKKKKCTESLPCAGYHTGLGDKVPSFFQSRGRDGKENKASLYGVKHGCNEGALQCLRR